MLLWLNNIIDHLLFAQLCPGCGTELFDHHTLICHHCRNQLPFTGFAFLSENKSERTFYGRVDIEQALSLLYFTKGSVVQNILHRIKYQGGNDLATYFGEFLGKEITDSPRLYLPDYIVPLPLHKKKQKIRGYNQAELISNGISKVLEKPVLTNLVSRTKNSQTQTRKHRQERWVNVENIFSLTGEINFLSGKRILLVDDVLTTGASLEACAQCIKDSIDDVRISIATLAIATH